MTKTTPLYNNHLQHNARCIDFAGYLMPVWFDSQKTEHLAVRQHAGMFDISHMGLIEVSGLGCDDFMSLLSCNNIKNGLKEKMIYSMFLNESGMILDDVMFGKLNNCWRLVVNGANTHKILNWMNQHKPNNVTVKLLNDHDSFIAVQGPQAISICSTIFNQDLSNISPFGMRLTEFDSQECLITRTGYTGESGFEIKIPNTHVTQLWDKLRQHGVTPCGLASRDSLRIEFGLPLYGQELSEHIHPFMTRYSWVVKFDHKFMGDQALTSLKQTDHLVAVGLQLQQSLIARPNYTIAQGGYITSGTLSPLLNKSIALALIPKQLAKIDSTVTVNIRSRQCEASITKVPFI